MKLLVLLLIIMNFLVFGWIRWGQPGPHDLPVEIHPERISLLSDAGSSTLDSAITPPSSTLVTKATPTPAAIIASIRNAHPNTQANAPLPAQPTLASATPNRVKTAPKPVQQPDRLCLEWGPIAPKHVEDAQARLIKLQLGNRLAYTDSTPQSGPYWVYFPPLPSKLAADDKLADLQSLGLKDIAVVRNGPWQNAISMGLYSKEAIANARVADAQKKGVAAKIEARGKSSRVYTLNNLTADEHNSLNMLQADFGGPALKKIVCTTP